MKNAAAIAAQLVDIRNVGQHKCVKLTIHVPAEQAGQVMAAFGWPTMVDPVPVALARLSGAALPAPAETAAGPAVPDQDRPHTPRKPVAAEKRLAMQAGICCADPVFQQFIMERYSIAKKCEETAAEFVRYFCDIQSRSELVPGGEAATRWLDLHEQFEAWKLEAAA